MSFVLNPRHLYSVWAVLALMAVMSQSTSPLCFAQPPLPVLPSPTQSQSASYPASSSSSPAFHLSDVDRAALLDAATRSGYTASEALSIAQTAYSQHIQLPMFAGSPSTPQSQQSAAASSALLSSSSSCPPADPTCSVAKACAKCFFDQSMHRCLPCLALLECKGQPGCQMQQACKVCSNIDGTEGDRPQLCNKLASHCE